LDRTSAEALFGGTSSVWYKTFTLTPTKVVIQVAASDDLAAENVLMSPEHILFSQDGEQIGIVQHLVELCLHAPDARLELFKRGDQSHKSFEIHSVPPPWEGKPMCLLKNDQEPPILRRIELVKTIGGMNFDIAQFQIQHGKLGDITVAWGSGLLKGQEAFLVASKEEKAEMKLSLAYAKQESEPK
jgi:hypothetical protein